MERCVGVEVGGAEETSLCIRRLWRVDRVGRKQQLGHELALVPELAQRSEPELACPVLAEQLART